jgi:hypothetical protein
MHAEPQPLLLPRGLIFLASLWLIASWLIAIGWRAPVEPVSASYTPGVRLMLLCVAVGLMVGWPLLRLSQRATPYPIRQTALDLVVLLALTQVVIWPLRLVTNWSAARTAALDTTLVGWSLLTGAIVAAAIGTNRPGPRTLAMLGCVGLCILGPLAAWLGVVSGVEAMSLIDLSPLLAVLTLGQGGGAPPTTEQWRWIALLHVAAISAWAAMLLAAALGIGRGGGEPKV